MAYPYIWAGPAWWRRVPEEASRKSARAVLVIFARGNGWRRKRWLTRQFRLENLCYPLCAHRLLLLAQASSLRKGNHHDSNFGGMGVVGCGPAHQSIFYILLTVFLVEVDKHGTNGIPPSAFDTLDKAAIPDRIKGSKMVVAVEQFWLAVVWGCKCCLLLLYSTMTSGLRQHRIVKVIGGICAFSFLLIEILFFAVWCRPFSAYWSVPPKSAQCSVYTNHVIITLVFNVATDVLIMAIPLPLLIRAKLSLSKKLTLCAVFSLGAFVILCSILSKYYSISQPYGIKWLQWYVREAATAVIVSNIPQTWTLFRRLFNWKSFLQHSSYNRSQNKYTSRLDSSTVHLSRLRGNKSGVRSTVDRSESGEHIAREQPLEIWAHRQFHVTNEVHEERRSGSLSQSSGSLEFDTATTVAEDGPVKTTVTAAR
ncbi:UbiD family decarboxylase, putative [Aspergillus fumigatus Af293]|uniref:UbiD family decarboxylase, putative n=2 Tax=cellular organisms TaxID=131567 RepID=Q4WAD6_ASPFU|nr:UbiD family decarboxylase, putative [Aspergillus fumigatus Af293]EAL84800.1 UbiD family decarboxylase, putative [Aspergillus fumigatus Af293]